VRSKRVFITTTIGPMECMVYISYCL